MLRWRPSGRNPAWFEVRYELALPIIAERDGTVSSGLAAAHHTAGAAIETCCASIAECIAGTLLCGLAVV